MGVFLFNRLVTHLLEATAPYSAHACHPPPSVPLLYKVNGVRVRLSSVIDMPSLAHFRRVLEQDTLLSGQDGALVTVTKKTDGSVRVGTLSLTKECWRVIFHAPKYSEEKVDILSILPILLDTYDPAIDRLVDRHEAAAPDRYKLCLPKNRKYSE